VEGLAMTNKKINLTGMMEVEEFPSPEQLKGLDTTQGELKKRHFSRWTFYPDI
jgi:hypothetical protein